jgi:hypothetical protein
MLRDKQKWKHSKPDSLDTEQQCQVIWFIMVNAYIKNNSEDMVAYASNPSTWEAETQGLWFPGQAYIVKPCCERKGREEEEKEKEKEKEENINTT